MSLYAEQEKAAVIQRLRPDFIIHDAQLLDGGLSNRCMKLSASDGRQFVWRPKSEATKVFGLSRQHEHDALLIASESGLAASPIALYSDGLLNAWVQGEVLDGIALDSIAILQAKVHDLPLLANRFDPFEKGLHYFSHLSPTLMSDDIKAIHCHFQHHAFKSELALTTCHYDLGYYNLIKCPAGELKIIDWEYAALGDPALDLVMTSLANDIELETLVNHYCRIRRMDNVALWQETCARWLPVAYYLGVLWFSLGYQLYGQPLYQDRALRFTSVLKDSLLQ
ncbi:phosphotransferase [Enterovibrio sp. FF113]|uniref:phosphotransferase n=1 Tax=Enterovibrio sp. FF113 TaxID=3230010 RepID=UPI00352C321F